jgi:hypothetical protein
MSNSPHDVFVRAVFSYTSVCRDFFEQLMPKWFSEQLAIDSITLIEGSFLTPELSEYYSDKCFRCLLKDGKTLQISLLLEHKSYVPPFIYDQLQRYVLERLESDRKEELPRSAVVPVVLYHGLERWRIRPPHHYFKGLPKSLRRFVKAPDYILIDISRFSKKKILSLRRGYLVNTLLILKYYKNERYLLHNTREIFMHGDFYNSTEEGRNFIHSLLVYFFELTKFDSKKAIAAIHEIHKPNHSVPMSTYEQLQKEGIFEKVYQDLLKGYDEMNERLLQYIIARKEEESQIKGMTEGEIKGKIEGKIEGIEEVALRLMVKFPEWTDQLMSEAVGLPEKKIRELRKRVAKPKSRKKSTSVN